jgi:hypothetical protein
LYDIKKGIFASPHTHGGAFAGRECVVHIVNGILVCESGLVQNSVALMRDNMMGAVNQKGLLNESDNGGRIAK